jgi:SPP1 family predicted phage head-tail adaptor
MIDPLIIPPGTLRHSITILAPSAVGTTFGGSGTTWTPVITTRASLQQIAAKSVYQTGALSTQVTHKLRMRYSRAATIKPGYQVTYSTHTYRVVNVDNVEERNRVIELLLLEVNGGTN